MLKEAALFLMVGSMAIAAPTVATITSPQPVSLDGHLLQGVVISSWPLVPGDSISTSASSATLSFKDGSSIELAKASTANLSGTVESPKLILTAGSLDYKIASGSKLVVTKADAVSKTVSNAPAQIGSSKTTRSSVLTSSLAYASIGGATAAGLLARSGSSSAAIPAASVSSGSLATPVSAVSAAPVAHNLPQLSCPINTMGFVLLYDPFVPASLGGPQITCWDPLIISPLFKHLYYVPSYKP